MEKMETVSKNWTPCISKVLEEPPFFGGGGEFYNFCPEKSDSMPRTNDNNLPDITASNPKKFNRLSSKKLQEIFFALLSDFFGKSLSLPLSLSLSLSILHYLSQSLSPLPPATPKQDISLFSSTHRSQGPLAYAIICPY